MRKVTYIFLAVMLCGCGANNAKHILAQFALPATLQVELLPHSAGLRTAMNYSQFSNIKSKLKGYSSWHILKESSVIEASGFSIRGTKDKRFIYATGATQKGYMKVLVYDKKNKIFYALFATGLM